MRDNFTGRFTGRFHCRAYRQPAKIRYHLLDDFRKNNSEKCRKIKGLRLIDMRVQVSLSLLKKPRIYGVFLMSLDDLLDDFRIDSEIFTDDSL